MLFVVCMSYMFFFMLPLRWIATFLCFLGGAALDSYWADPGKLKPLLEEEDREL